MSIRDDLIAAKALIDAPEKWDHCSVAAAMDAVTGHIGERRRAISMAHSRRCLRGATLIATPPSLPYLIAQLRPRHETPPPPSCRQ